MEESGQNWAIFSPTPPYILVYSTSHWRDLFGLQNKSDDITIKSFQDFIMNETLFQNLNVINNNNNNNGSNKTSNNQTNHNDEDDPIHPTTTALLQAFSFNRSISKSGNLHYTTNSKIDMNYMNSSNEFLIQLNELNESHGIVPMSRQLGRTIDSFLCSLHAFAIFPSRELQTINNNNNNNNKPAYYAILFNELKDQVILNSGIAATTTATGLFHSTISGLSGKSHDTKNSDNSYKSKTENNNNNNNTFTKLLKSYLTPCSSIPIPPANSSYLHTHSHYNDSNLAGINKISMDSQDSYHSNSRILEEFTDV